MIETTRLTLRPFRESDAEDVLEYLHEPAVNCFADMKINSLYNPDVRPDMRTRYSTRF